MKCEKIKYSTESEAHTALRHQQRWNANVMRVYFCSGCKKYHLTSTIGGGYKENGYSHSKRRVPPISAFELREIQNMINSSDDFDAEQYVDSLGGSRL